MSLPSLVLDTATLQALHRSGLLGLLSSGSVTVPGTVAAENQLARRSPNGPALAADLSTLPWVVVAPAAGPAAEASVLGALALALARSAVLVTREKDATAKAKQAGVTVWSLVALLDALKAEGHAVDLGRVAADLEKTGFHDDELKQRTGQGYQPRLIEPKWQQVWANQHLTRAGARPNAPKKYVLEMFPYPSGNMHMGHVRNYLIGDVLARYYRMRGFDVLHPFGWDALGLPAENAAIKDKRHPAERTAENIKTFRADTVALGLSYDWEREVNTSDPAYYKWNQWFFVKMLEKGLVYRRHSEVNWCPGCATVIANEQVSAEGKCERSGDVVEKRLMPEWAFRVTRYAEELLAGLDTLTDWPTRITAMQRHWIGKSEGAEVEFKLAGREGAVRVFTTRIDTIFGCTYVVISPEHKLAKEITTPEHQAELAAFVAELRLQDAASRTDEGRMKGIFTGAYAVNPFTGEKVPVWAANFVLANYGTGAVMSVPAHDQRDFLFAKKYALAIKQVISKGDWKAEGATEAMGDDGVLVDSGAYTGKTSELARKELTAEAVARGLGLGKVNYKFRDWGFSRQRYWGTPIPIVYCDRCDPEKKGIPVPVEQLPVKLPDIDVAEVLTGTGQPPLAKVPSWVNTTCPVCGGSARRETETMDTFVDSTWYFARYLSPKDATQPFSRAEADRWLPVDIYVGGPEHAVMHLLYFRFWTRVMKDLGLTSVEEPVKRLITQGMVLSNGKKMSKRGGNVVSPVTVIERFGADTARMFVMFAGPADGDIEWSDEQVQGCARFLHRVWKLAQAHIGAAGAKFSGDVTGEALAIRKVAHKCLKRVTESMEKLSFNTAIAGIMESTNAWNELKGPSGPNVDAAWAEAMTFLAVCLSPFAPHLADELAQLFGATAPLQAQAWPEFDAKLVVDDTVKYAIQVNGKLRGEIEVPTGAGQEEVVAAARADAGVAAQLAGKTEKKVVFVPKRLVNFVVA